MVSDWFLRDGWNKWFCYQYSLHYLLYTHSIISLSNTIFETTFVYDLKNVYNKFVHYQYDTLNFRLNAPVFKTNLQIKHSILEVVSTTLSCKIIS